jgi:hypothetical protein
MSVQSVIANIKAGAQAAWSKRGQSQQAIDFVDASIGNGWQWFWRDSNDANDLAGIGYDSDNAFRLGNAVQVPLRSSVRCALFPNANQVTQTFFVNPTSHAIYITGISEIHTTAGSVAGAAVAITHETQVGGLMQASGTGKSVMSGTFDLHATAETVQNATLATNYRTTSRNNNVASSSPGAGLIVLQPGDSLSAKFSGTLTTLAGVVVTLYMAPGCKFEFVSYYAAAAGALATSSLLTSLRPRTLIAGAALWQVKESTAATLTLDVTKDASATAPGGGTSMLSATVNLKGAALTFTQMGLSETAANLTTISTDSVAIKASTSATELAGLCVTLAFDGKQNEISINYNPSNSTLGTDEELWIADRDYEVLDFAGKWSHVGTSNFIAATRDAGTSTPGSGGVLLQTDNTNKGFDITGTINVPVFATLSALNTRILRQGSRIGLHNQGTPTNTTGFQMSMRLRGM